MESLPRVFSRPIFGAASQFSMSALPCSRQMRIADEPVESVNKFIIYPSVGGKRTYQPFPNASLSTGPFYLRRIIDRTGELTACL
jgi:hypothetical protein